MRLEKVLLEFLPVSRLFVECNHRCSHRIVLLSNLDVVQTSSLAQIDPSSLCLSIGIQHGMAHLSTIAALLVPTKRCSCIKLVIGVDPHYASFEGCHHFMDFLLIIVQPSP